MLVPGRPRLLVPGGSNARHASIRSDICSFLAELARWMVPRLDRLVRRVQSGDAQSKDSTGTRREKERRRRKGGLLGVALAEVGVYVYVADAEGPSYSDRGEVT